MLAEMVSVVVMLMGPSQTDKVALRKALNVSKAVQTGGYRKVAQFEPCVWPRRCSKKAKVELLAAVTTCQWPNPCGRSSLN